jgi:hypothetical protein
MNCLRNAGFQFILILKKERLKVNAGKKLGRTGEG